MISREAPLPLHLQFRHHLLELLEQGELKPGAQVPPERALAAQFGVSLAPVRQAILDLVKEGYLYRVRGRGTFVAESVVEEKIAILSSFTASMRAKGLEPRVHVLRQELEQAPPRIREALQTRDRTLLVIERVASVHGQPVAMLTSHLLPRRFPGLAATRLEGRSLYETLKETYNATPGRAESTIEVIRCSFMEATLLGITTGSPALQVAGTTFDEKDRPMEYARVLYRADRFRFRLDSYRHTDQVIHVIDGGRAGRRLD